MKIIQSFWTLPSKKNSHDDNFGRKNGGWLNEKYHAMSWAMSCLKFKQFYKEVEIYVDSDGSDWLINKVGLPYSNVHTISVETGFNPSLWALAKLTALSTQNFPFLHADGDVYIWKPFPIKFLSSKLFSQNIEFDITGNLSGNIYIETLKLLVENRVHLPVFFKEPIESFKKTGRIDAYNMGIVGGQNSIFFKQYVNELHKFLDQNKEIKLTGRDMNFVEQFFFYCYSKYHNFNVDVLFEEENVAGTNSYSSMIQFNLIPISKTYVHVIGLAKKSQIICSQLSSRLHYEFPQIHKHILSLYKEKKSYGIARDSTHVDKNNFQPVFSCSKAILNDMGIEYPPGSYEDLFDIIEDLLVKTNKNRSILSLNDIYQFEKFHYLTTKISNKINLKANDTTLLNALYNSSIPEFLNYKFALNINSVAIASVNFKYPEHILISELNKIMTRKNNTQLENDIVLLTLSSPNNLKAEVINDWRMLLLYFEDNPVSGCDLVQYLRDERLNYNLKKDNLQSFVLSFLTTFSVHFNYLKLVTA
ncbi:DUF6734 family protein [Mucilaginibacter sp.]|uniref:DUF6734 family protein n=1 Tax=Mucilaginibacter sp. TaxID=1882438 RepID=UPI00261BD4AB|nr:DUF6734 family protein [Mucilaginibacter sp.]MDB4926555.1 hypothetical protein [Mucilaginibacter sp.]